MKRLIVVVAALTGALLVQLTIVNGLQLPGGGVPDLVLLCVAAIGLTGGAEPGLVAGFCAGLAIDLAPPGNELIGQYALVFCLVGYGSGRLKFAVRHSALLALAAAVAAVTVGEVLAGCLAVILDTPQVTLSAVIHSLPSSLVYDLVLIPVVMFAAVRAAIALGVSFNPLDDTPALEPGGSARPMGMARLARLRLGRQALAGEGIAGGGNWLTGDTTASLPAIGHVGWLSGPATSRRARRQQAKLSAALTGAEPRRGAVWVGNRPAGLRPVGTEAHVQASDLRKLRPGSGLPGSALRQGAPMAMPAGRDQPPSERGVPKIAFGTGGGSGARRPAVGGGVPKIAFDTGGLTRPGRPAGPPAKKIAFGTGSLPGAGRAAGRQPPKIAFKSGLPRGPRTTASRPALPSFRSRSGTSAAGPWLAASRLRSAHRGAGGRGRHPKFTGGPSYLSSARSYRPKTVRWTRRRRYLDWLPFGRRPGGRSTVWRITRQIGGER